MLVSLLHIVAFFAATGWSLKFFRSGRLHFKAGANSSDYFNRPGPWDDKTLNSLLDANKAWCKRMVKERPEFFNELKKGHAPKILWIGCSDARVPANEVIGEPPGSVFVHRNIANMVVNTDFNCLSVVQYAVDVLKVKHIIVCGHYDCGGVRASLEPVDHKSPLENWLRNIRDTQRLHKDELNAIQDKVQRQRRLVELNVIEQCVNIFKTAVVQRRRLETHQMIGKPGSNIHFSEPRVHAFVYEPTTGEAKKLPVNFTEYLKEIKHVYELYQVDPLFEPEKSTKAPPPPAAPPAAGGAHNYSVHYETSASTNTTISDIESMQSDDEEIAIQEFLDSSTPYFEL